MRFKIITVGWNCERYIDKCIVSVLGQSHKDWDMQVILDPCTDSTYDIAYKAANGRIPIRHNTTRRYGIANQIACIRAMRPQNDDVLVWLDGDDWLASPVSLQLLAEYYEKNPKALVSHGSWESHPLDPNGWNNNRPYTVNDFKVNIRFTDWRAAHLRTMRYRIWRQILDCDFRTPDGKYMTTAFDTMAMFPALEMAGPDRVMFIPDILHVYNRENPLGDWKMERAEEQAKVANYIKHLPQYPRLEHAEVLNPEVWRTLFSYERFIAKNIDGFGNMHDTFVELFGREPQDGKD